MYSGTQTRTLEPYIRTNWALAKLSALRAREQLAQALVAKPGYHGVRALVETDAGFNLLQSLG